MADSITLKSVQNNGSVTLVANNQTILLQGKAQGPRGIQGIQGDPATNLVTSVAGRQGVVVLDKTDVGLGNADNTNDLSKPISTATQTALDTKATTTALNAHASNTSNPHSVTKAQVGLGNADNTSDVDKPISAATQTALDAKATNTALDAHTNNTSNPHSVTKAQVGLGNVDNTADLDKVVSTATQTALNGKFTQRTITGTTNQVTVTNGDGVSGNPTLSLPQDIHTGATPTFATPTAAGHAAIKSYVDAADLAHVAATDPHTQYMNSDRGDARYAGQPYAVMAKSQFASLSSSYGILGRIFGNDGYKNDLQVYGLSTQASTPTPDVPVPIVSTTGNVTVRSASPSKNLFDGGVGITTGFYYDVSGTAAASASDYIQTAYIPVLPNTTYTMSHSGSSSPKAVQYTSGQTFISRSVTVGGTSVTFTTTSNTAFVRLSSATTQLATTQLELGSVATAFVPHNVTTQTLPLSTTQLRSLPNGVSDRIYKDGSTWKLEQNLGVRVLNGVENYTLNNIYATNVQFISIMGVPSVSGQTGIISSHLKTQAGDDIVNSIWIYGTSTLVINLDINIASTVAAFRTWLASNNITIQYTLATPITTTITDPTLITALENIRTYQGVTNITASTPVSGSYGLDTTKALAGKVDTTGSQTIAGVKTFTSAPIAPSGTSIGGVLHLTGTGFPNGVVSAPVGSIYIDTAVTNGASSWIKKSGTGNTGWQVLEGDTGWRNVVSLLSSFWQSGVGAFAVRRIGATVFVRVDGVMVAASPTGQRITAKSFTADMWPAGFRQQSWGANLSGASVAGYPGIVLPMATQSDLGVSVYGAGLSSTGNWTLDDYIAFQYQYSTSEDWPTTLP